MAYDTGTLIPTSTISANGVSAAFPLGVMGGTSSIGMNLHIEISQVFGNPNVQFYIETLLPDGVTWVFNKFDEGGPVNVAGLRNIKFESKNQSYRLGWVFGQIPGSFASLNSSSLSSQSFGSSYSAAPLGALTFQAGIVANDFG